MGKWLCVVFAWLLTLPGCGSDETPTRPNDFTPLTDIVIEAGLDTLAKGTSTQLIAKGNYSGQFTRDITRLVLWSSDQSATADFLFSDTPGRISALSAGGATITASLDGIHASHPLAITAATITSMSVSPKLFDLPLGLTQSFAAEGVFSDLTRQDLTFDASWSSSDNSVATVSNEYASKGVAVALKVGTAAISAEFEGLTANAQLNVTAPIPLSIAITPAGFSLLSLSTEPFTAMAKYSDGSSVDVTTSAIWTSTNTGVAAVDQGLVKSLSPGATTISAKVDDVEGRSNLKVTGGNLQGVALTLSQADRSELIKDTLSRVVARGTFDNGTTREISGAIETWGVDSAKATISPASGNLVWVEALAATTGTTLSATYGRVPAGEITLVVTEPQLTDLTILEQSQTLSAGTSKKLTLAGIFSPVSNQNLAPSATWMSGAQAIATVGDLGLESGRVRALAAGTSTITATYGAKSATTTVTVVARTLQGLSVYPVTSPNPIIAGTEKRFMAEALYSDGTRQDVTADVTWTIDHLNVAKFSDPVADPGLLVAVDAGTTTLTAQFAGKEDKEVFVVSQ